jgi:CheY-like chemotaxis protein
MNPSTPRVLAVDDDPLILDIITEMLAGTGCVLETVADGEAAWERLVSAAEPIDVVLLDWQMPGLDGMHLLQRIKSTPTMLELPVIMQTSMADKARVAEGLANGAFYYLVKPFSQAELRAITHAASPISLMPASFAGARTATAARSARCSRRVTASAPPPKRRTSGC